MLTFRSKAGVNSLDFVRAGARRRGGPAPPNPSPDLVRGGALRRGPSSPPACAAEALMALSLPALED